MSATLLRQGCMLYVLVMMFVVRRGREREGERGI